MDNYSENYITARKLRNMRIHTCVAANEGFNATRVATGWIYSHYHSVTGKHLGDTFVPEKV